MEEIYIHIHGIQSRLPGDICWSNKKHLCTRYKEGVRATGIADKNDNKEARTVSMKGDRLCIFSIQ
ncbi:hypothetical protein QR98_0036560 [Sarcoptes scabiei]|uniref:Uncharacterized protein n=1 Tax=Sarcoptes scabiei TaxID=52283 RepID=A0A132A2G8_SARSC|nr:hypothetical protein QR98_0036560 [Sarcoptes scabiei]